MFVSISVQPCPVCYSLLSLFTPPPTASGLLTNQEGEDRSMIDACAKDIPVYPAEAVQEAGRHPEFNTGIILSVKS